MYQITVEQLFSRMWLSQIQKVASLFAQALTLLRPHLATTSRSWRLAATGNGRSGRSFARLISLARLGKEEAHVRGTQGRDAYGRRRRAGVERCDPGRHNEVRRRLRLRGRRPQARLEVTARSRAGYGHAPRRR